MIIISPLPYVTLFKQLVDIIGPMFFDHGESLFEVAWNCIRQWPDPSPGRCFELPILGNILKFTIPYIEIPTYVRLEA